MHQSLGYLVTYVCVCLLRAARLAALAAAVPYTHGGTKWTVFVHTEPWLMLPRHQSISGACHDAFTPPSAHIVRSIHAMPIPTSRVSAEYSDPPIFRPKV